MASLTFAERFNNNISDKVISQFASVVGKEHIKYSRNNIYSKRSREFVCNHLLVSCCFENSQDIFR